jgi:hypothetical protein
MMYRYTICRTASTLLPGSHLLLEKKAYPREQATANFLMVRSNVEGGHASSSRLIFDILVARTRISGPSNRTTLLKFFKRFGTKFTKEM